MQIFFNFFNSHICSVCTFWALGASAVGGFAIFVGTFGLLRNPFLFLLIWQISGCFFGGFGSIALHGRRRARHFMWTLLFRDRAQNRLSRHRYIQIFLLQNWSSIRWIFEQLSRRFLRLNTDFGRLSLNNPGVIFGPLRLFRWLHGCWLRVLEHLLLGGDLTLFLLIDLEI